MAWKGKLFCRKMSQRGYKLKLVDIPYIDGNQARNWDIELASRIYLWANIYGDHPTNQETE